MKRVYTSESVFDGHPDKVCDRISDEILDAVLEQDKNGRVAVETTIKNDTVYIIGEVTTTALIDYSLIAKRTLLNLGYLNNFKVIENISKQSPDIALGVDERANKKQGAGDQGHPACTALWFQVLRKDFPACALSPQFRHEPGGDCRLRAEPHEFEPRLAPSPEQFR